MSATRAIPFVERDLRDQAIAEEAKRRTGVRLAPITVVGRQAFYGAFAQQKPRILAALGLAEAA